MNIINEYEPIKIEIKQIRDNIMSLMKLGEKEEQLYKGTIVFFSNLNYQPDFLFIGINPGSGFYKTTGIKYRETELDPDDDFEYLSGVENGYDYNLAKQTREVFSKTNHYQKLYNSVKINHFYTCTDNFKELEEFNRIIGQKYSINLKQYSKKWTLKLIEIIKPKVIICEGKISFNLLMSYFEKNPSWVNDVSLQEIDNRIIAIGYRRNYSNIPNKESLIRLLNTIEI